jgi:hypothetical protein
MAFLRLAMDASVAVLPVAGIVSKRQVWLHSV